MKAKRWIGVVLAVVLVIALGATVSAAAQTIQTEITYRNIKITLNGEALEPKDATGNTVEPFIMNGTTYLPVRAISGALGLTVGWDDKTSTVILTEGADDVFITRTGSKYHHDGNCNGGTYWPVPFETAVGMGLKPCDKCVN